MDLFLIKDKLGIILKNPIFFVSLFIKIESLVPYD